MHRVVGTRVEIVLHDAAVPSAPVAFEREDIPPRTCRTFDDGADRGAVICIEGDVEDLKRLRQVPGIAGPDDGRRDPGLVEHPTRRHRGKRHAVAVPDRLQHRQKILEQIPRPELVDYETVLHERPVLEGETGVGRPEPALRQKSAGERAVASSDMSRSAAHPARPAAGRRSRTEYCTWFETIS